MRNQTFLCLIFSQFLSIYLDEIIYVAATCWFVEADAYFGRLTFKDRLAGQVVRRPTRERKVPGSNLACGGTFSGSSHTSDLKIGTPSGYPARRLAL